MELQSLSKPSAANLLTRRAWFLAPAGLAAFGAWYLTRERPLPDPSENGSGEFVTIKLFPSGQTIQVRKLVKTSEEWRKQLGAEAFAVTRQQATEFAFHNLYWNNHDTGIYRCVCCGNALFRSMDKFDSDTGWPSFTAPIAAENISMRPDMSIAELRTEVLCKKCDAHLGHLFDDGPAPTHKRYCLNSAALRFIHT